MDYKKIGFKCGIEIHQQLETHKLFCECPSLVNDPNKADISFTRKLRAVAGETGELDKAAKHEQKKDKIVHYEACNTSSCLVELDEEPPHDINKEAVRIVLQVAQILNARVVDEIQVMRKTVVDGSNVSGFQRTALVATDGYIETSMGKVRIPSVCLEEEAAKKLSENKDSVTYRLDRLGVALIEIATETDIKSPEHAKETAEKIGMILRSTGKVKRGIGTIRQDVNISINGGARIEIKGFQDLKSIPKVIEYEIRRQEKLITAGKKVKSEVRKAEPDGTTTFMRPMPGSARMYPETDIPPIIPDTKKISKIELLDDKVERFQREYKLGKDLSRAIAKSVGDLFENLAKRFKSLKPAFIAESLISIPKEARRENKVEIELKESDYEKLFSMLDDGRLTKENLIDAAIGMSKGTFDEKRYKKVDEKDIKEDIKKIVEKMKGKPFGAIMGEVMKKYRGKLDGKRLSEIIRGLM